MATFGTLTASNNGAATVTPTTGLASGLLYTGALNTEPTHLEPTVGQIHPR